MRAAGCHRGMRRIRSRGHAADPRHEALAQLKAEQAALEKSMQELLRVPKPTEEQNRQYCRLKANHAAVLKKQASLCLVCAPPPAPSAPKCLATSATPASPLTPTPPAAFAATAVEGKQAARVEVAASGVSPSGVSPVHPNVTEHLGNA